jgi:hypothetical protein
MQIERLPENGTRFRSRPVLYAEKNLSQGRWRSMVIRFAQTSADLLSGARLELTMLIGRVRHADQHSGSTSTVECTPAPAPAVRVLMVTRYSERMDVYNLEVEDQHEYFANGVLVHNCYDATRYALTQINPKPRPQPGAGEMLLSDPLARFVRTGGVLGSKDF